MNRRTRQFLASMGGYAIFSLLALATLTDKIRIAVLIVLGALALMTWLVWWRERQSSKRDNAE
ncbi:MAG: hypothetical protein IT160_16015 [Bryobacterales bacterium]|nr:hypothetical protein [Bryobacterales bacterium]